MGCIIAMDEMISGGPSPNQLIILNQGFHVLSKVMHDS